MMNHPFSPSPDLFLSTLNIAPEESQLPEPSPFLSKYHVAVPAAILANFNRTSCELDADYQPQDHDVVCGRGKGSYNRPGNVAFRLIVKGFIRDYLAAKTKFEKSTVLNQIIDHVHGRQARFLKFNNKTKQWFEISDDQAREKVGHTMRESIAAFEQINQRETKQHDLLMNQKAIFEALVRAPSSSRKRLSYTVKQKKQDSLTQQLEV